MSITTVHQQMQVRLGRQNTIIIYLCETTSYQIDNMEFPKPIKTRAKASRLKTKQNLQDCNFRKKKTTQEIARTMNQ